MPYDEICYQRIDYKQKKKSNKLIQELPMK